MSATCLPGPRILTHPSCCTSPLSTVPSAHTWPQVRGSPGPGPQSPGVVMEYCSESGSPGQGSKACLMEGPSWPLLPSASWTSALALAQSLLMDKTAEMWAPGRAHKEPSRCPSARGASGPVAPSRRVPQPGLSSTSHPQVWSDKQLRRRPMGTLPSMGQTPPMA